MDEDKTIKIPSIREIIYHWGSGYDEYRWIFLYESFLNMGIFPQHAELFTQHCYENGIMNSKAFINWCQHFYNLGQPVETCIDNAISTIKEQWRRAEKQKVVPTNQNYPPSNAIQYAPNQPAQIGLGPNGETLSRVMDPNVAGVSFEQAQALNYEKAKDNQKLSRRQKELDQDSDQDERKKERERRHKRLINEEEERHAEAMLKIKSNLAGSQLAPFGASFGVENSNPNDYVQKFVEEKHVVREKRRRDSDDVVLYMWDDEDCIYCQITQKRLSVELQSFWSENDIPNDSKIEQFTKQIRYKLSLDLNKSGLNIADGNQTFFPNGYFDIKSGNFCPCDTVEWFHNFCIPYDYDENASNPDNFDQILNQLFDGDETKIKLAYQIIGALISEVRSLKEIYVFQGVTNSGKTTLASIILKLLDKHERKKLNSVTEITDDALKKLSKSVRVVCIKDSGQEALKVNSVSYLKNYASGDFEEDEIYFTMLLQTNNPIYSDKSGNIEKALHDRFLVLPFAKDMKTALGDTQVDPIQVFMDNHFEKEKRGIVKKALGALHEVMSSGKRFVHRFPLNECIGGTINVSRPERENTSKELSTGIAKKNELHKLIETCFDVIDLANFQANPKECVKAQDLLEIVKKKLPVFGQASVNSLGKNLNGMRVADKTIEKVESDGKTYYNLRQKT